MAAVMGKEPVIIREGGSIPPVEVFQRVLGIQSVLVGVGLPDDQIHAPNEKFHLPYFYKDINQIVRFLDLVGTDPAIATRPDLVANRRQPRRSARAKPGAGEALTASRDR
jgi:hypothetical protein